MGWVRCGLGTPSSVLSLPTPSEASGVFARFNTDLTENLLSAVAEFSASQASGTPTPSAPIPIVGVDKVNVTRTGKNLWDEDWEGGTYSTADGRPSASANAIRSKNRIAIKPSLTFAFFNSTANAQIRLYYYDKSGTFLSWEAKTAVNNVATFTTPENAYFINFAVGNSSTPVTTNNQNLSLNYPSTDTEYHAYTGGTTALINLGGTYYGGEVDAVTGKITLTHGIGQITSVQNINGTWDSQAGKGAFWYATSSQCSWLSNWDNSSVNNGAKCDKFVLYSNISNNTTVNGLCLTTAGIIRWVDLDRMSLSLSDYNTYLANNPITVIYKLKTPVVVYASNTAEIPTIVGDNQVYADTGDVAVKFFETVGHKI